ncbi:hypothetical protein PybrP1_003136 [[Pythium] brassicae (nom. inval.)]|nr:hypothetical protein PybrP1_003136 [[Pythium] brassicae (nom. inval.)]
MLVARTRTSSRRLALAALARRLSSAGEVPPPPPPPPAASKEKAKAKKASPMQNLRDAMDALDLMIEEAEKKVVKKYRPNMFAEFKQLNDTGGKVVVAPETLADVAKAAPFPSLRVTSLTGEDADLQQVVAGSRRVTLVLTSFKNFGLNMLPAWRDAFATEFGAAGAQTVTLNIIEDWYMKLVQRSITRGLQEKAPAATHALTFAHFGRCDDFRTALDLYNSFTGYAHLVDAKGRVRWMYVATAAGEATPEDLERLMRVTRQLLEQSSQSRRR